MKMKRLYGCTALLLLCGTAIASTRFAEERAAFLACRPLASGVSFASIGGDFAAADVLCIRGRIDHGLSLQVARYLGQNTGFFKPPRYIVVSGPGGQLRPAIAIAQLIERTNATLVVGDVCASACSQFLFVAGKRKVILSGGVVAFHGGPLSLRQVEAITREPTAKASLLREQEEFIHFYQERGLDMRMLTEPPDDISRRLASGEFVMWSWPAEKLEAFGVGQVEVED